MDLLYFFKSGGFIMYPLVVCSILVWTIAIERIRFLSIFRQQAFFLYSKACNLMREKKIHEVKGVCVSVMDTVSAPYLALIEGAHGTDLVKEQRVTRKLRETSLYLRRFLWMLATMAAVAPFLGLFGTVVGIMRSFNSIGASGKSGFAIIAPGLAEALITTAGGILVAIMALIIYNYLQASLVKIMLEFKGQLEEVAELYEE